MTARLDQSLAKSVMKKAGWKPLTPYTNSYSPWKSTHIKCGRTSKPRFVHIKNGRTACPYCAKKSRAEKQKLNPEVAFEVFKKANLQPLEPYKNSGHRWLSECLHCGKRVRPTYDHVKARGAGCNYCAKKKSGVSQRIPEEVAIAIMESHGLTPLEPYKGLSHKWKAICKVCKRKSSPQLAHIKHRGGKCRFCAKNKQLSKRDWSTRLKEKGATLIGPFVSAQFPCLIRCGICGTERYIVLAEVNWKRGGVCLTCATRQRGIKRRKDEGEAEEIMKMAKLQPLEPYVNSSTPWKSLCLSCGAIVNPKFGHISSGQGGCSACANYGFNSHKPAYLYFIENLALGAFKVGIANSGKIKKNDRLNRHLNHGWAVIQVWSFPKGEEARRAEKLFFGTLKTRYAANAPLTRKQMKYGGETETFANTSIDKRTVINLLAGIMRQDQENLKK